MSAPVPRVRRASRSDLGALSALFAELLAHHAAIERAFRVHADANERLPGLLAHQLADPDVAVFVCEETDGPIGFCSVRVRRAADALVETARAEIADLAVRGEYRRRGIGRALAAAARAWARQQGAERLEVRVAARNREGQAFWRALGYEDFVDVLQHRL